MMEGHNNIWTLVLAAGASSRFGGAKALALWGTDTLLAKTLATAAALTGPRVMTVTGGYAEALYPHMQDCPSVFNSRWREGLGTSLSSGIQAVLQSDPYAEMIVILMIDQPLVTPAFLRKLIATALQKDCCSLAHNGLASGLPAAIPRRYFSLLASLNGNEGLKKRLGEQDIEKMPAPFQMQDVDTPVDLHLLQKYYLHSSFV